MEEEEVSFLPRTTSNSVDLKSFESCLKWVCVDQSNLWRVGLSWSVFFILAIVVPLASHFAFNCTDCDANHRRPYHAVVQLSLSVFSTISFLCLSRWSRKYCLRRFLFLDKLGKASDKVRLTYEQQVQSFMKLWSYFIIPCFAVEAGYKLWGYISGGSTIPHYGNIYMSDPFACTLELFSWLYRTSMFFLVCVLYRLIFYLQILRLEDFAKVFQKETEVESILHEHLSFRRCLRIISHLFRVFILLTLVLVTASQFISLLIITRSVSDTNHFKAGDLLEGDSGETPSSQITSAQVFPIYEGWLLEDEEGDGDDELDNAKMIPVVAHKISFQKRQALVTYLENNRAGITVFGFMLDRNGSTLYSGSKWLSSSGCSTRPFLEFSLWQRYRCLLYFNNRKLVIYCVQ